MAGSTLLAASEVVTMMRPERRGRMCRAAARSVANTPLRIHVDHTVPALVGVVLERALRHALAITPHPTVDEAGAGVDAGVGEYHIQAAVQFGGGFDRRFERGMIGHVDRGAAHVMAGRSQSRGLPRDRLGI